MLIRNTVGMRSLVSVVLVFFMASSVSANLFSIFKKKKPVDLEIKVLAQILDFREAARIQPEETFIQYAGDKAQAMFAPLGRKLCPISDPSQGWAYFFETSVLSVSFINDTTALALFYHPWSDVALITAWTCSNKGNRITDAELLMGDVLRHQGAPPYDIEPHCLRTSNPPYTAGALASAQTVADFQRTFSRDHNDLKDGWRTAMSHAELLEFNHKGLGYMFEQNLIDLARLRHDPNEAPIRDRADEILKQFQLGQIDDVLKTAPDTLPESRALLAASAREWGQAQLLAYVTRQDEQKRGHAFILFSLQGRPEYVMSFWFQKDDKGTAVLRRIDFVDQNKALINMDEIKKLSQTGR